MRHEKNRVIATMARVCAIVNQVARPTSVEDHRRPAAGLMRVPNTLEKGTRLARDSCRCMSLDGLVTGMLVLSGFENRSSNCCAYDMSLTVRSPTHSSPMPDSFTPGVFKTMDTDAARGRTACTLPEKPVAVRKLTAQSTARLAPVAVRQSIAPRPESA